MITVGAADEKVKLLWTACDEGCREVGKSERRPKLLQLHVSLGAAPTRRPLRERADRVAERRDAFFPKQDIKNPEDFAAMAKLVRPRGLQEPGPDLVAISKRTRPHIQHYVDMGFDEIHLHNVGRNQAEFIEVFGREVLPNLRLG